MYLYFMLEKLITFFSVLYTHKIIYNKLTDITRVLIMLRNYRILNLHYKLVSKTNVQSSLITLGQLERLVQRRDINLRIVFFLFT